MEYSKIEWDDLGVTAEVGTFSSCKDGGKEGLLHGESDDVVAEMHVILHVEPRGELFEGQLARITAAETRIAGLLTAVPVTKRYFLSDAANQVHLMKHDVQAGISYIQQPPLDGSKVAVWLYLLRGASITHEGDTCIVSHNGYRHVWKMGMTKGEGTSFMQTSYLLEEYENELDKYDATLADNCLRTWFYVRDVDTQYAGMVKARTANFLDHGLTPHTHYLASTGIQGLPADTDAIIQLDTYAVVGLVPEQQRYLYALDYLNPTIEYGVTFERGTLVKYGDRAHALISGTASINNKGEVVHVGDIVSQTRRMWTNVEALLAEAEMTMADCAYCIVYLRDVSDYDCVRRMFAEQYPDLPAVFTLAPVCRPSWLIEMECIGIAERDLPQYRRF